MPEITTQLLLNILLVIIVLLFVPFGVRRGGAREAMVSAGLLLGATLADRWTPAAAERLARLGWVDLPTASFIVSLAFLLGGAFVLGYGGAAVAGASRISALSRVSGAVLAALNGMLFLGFLLQYIVLYMRPGATLTDGYVTNLLLTRFDQLLLAAAGLLLVWLILGWIIGMARGNRAQPVDPLVGQRGRPVRNAPVADTGKYEPTPTPAANEAYNVTAPLPMTGPDDPWRRPAAMNGHATASNQADWTRPIAAEPVNPAANPYAPPTTASGVWGATDTRRAGYGDDRRRCPSCGALAGPNDLYCPECGKTI